MILITFQMVGILLFFSKWLKMLVRALTALCPRICRQGLWIVGFFVFLMALAVMSEVKKWACLSRVIMCSLWRMCLSCASSVSACCWSVGIVLLLCVRLTSSVVWLTQYLLLRPRMSLNSLEGLVWKEKMWSVCSIWLVVRV